MSKVCGIYKITNPERFVYIGQSRDCATRCISYKSNKGKGQPLLQASIKKHGWHNHTFEVIHPCTEAQLNTLEIYYIALFQCYNTTYGLNLRKGGEGKQPKQLPKKAEYSIIVLPSTTIDIYAELRAIIGRKDWKVEDIAVIWDVKPTQVKNIMKGRTELTWKHIAAICEAADVDINFNPKK